MALGGFPGFLAGLGAVNQGANLGTLQAAQALRQLYAAQQDQQALQQQQQWQQYAGPIWQGLQQQLQPPTGGQQVIGQDIASAAAGYQPGAVQNYPLPSVPQQMPPPMMTGASTTPYGVSPGQMRNDNFATLPMAKQQVLAGEGSRPGQIGKAGEEGRMQVLPSTERAMGFAPGTALYSDKPGEAYLGKLAQETGGNLPATVGGYNRGEGWAKAWQAAAGNPQQQAKLIQQLAPAYQRIVYADMFRKTQNVAKIAGPEVAQGTQDVAHTALQSVDPATYGRQQLAQTWQMIEQAAPGAPGAVKFMALGLISKIMQPADQMALRLQMQQNQNEMRAAIAELQAQTRVGVATMQTQAANERAQAAQTAAGVRQGAREAAADERQQKALAAKGAEGGPETVDAAVNMIGQYRLPPLSGWTLRSPWGQQVIKGLSEKYPDYSAAQYAAGVSGARAFATGKQGDITRFMSVAIDHLGVADQLGKALSTGDTRALNAVKAALATQFGYSGPLNFDVAKMIVGDEVTKAIAGGTLSMEERLALQSKFSTASSPEQLAGVSDTLKRLLAGQLRGLERQYETLPGAKPDFQQKLSPQAREQLEGKPAAGGGQNLDVTEEQYNKLPSGAAYTVPGNPKVMYKQ